jgi:hypothetical protein
VVSDSLTSAHHALSSGAAERLRQWKAVGIRAADNDAEGEEDPASALQASQRGRPAMTSAELLELSTRAEGLKLSARLHGRNLLPMFGPVFAGYSCDFEMAGFNWVNPLHINSLVAVVHKGAVHVGSGELKSIPTRHVLKISQFDSCM